jgi:hypothetical protein
MSLLIKHFSRIFKNIQSPEERNVITTDINNAIKEKFDDAKCNGYMFGLDVYDCYITSNVITGHLKVTYHRRWKPKVKPGEPNPWKLSYSHEIDFDKFCYRYCNPGIIHIIEKILFQRL